MDVGKAKRSIAQHIDGQITKKPKLGPAALLTQQEEDLEIRIEHLKGEQKRIDSVITTYNTFSIATRDLLKETKEKLRDLWRNLFWSADHSKVDEEGRNVARYENFPDFFQRGPLPVEVWRIIMWYYVRMRRSRVACKDHAEFYTVYDRSHMACNRFTAFHNFIDYHNMSKVADVMLRWTSHALEFSSTLGYAGAKWKSKVLKARSLKELVALPEWKSISFITRGDKEAMRQGHMPAIRITMFSKRALISVECAKEVALDLTYEDCYEDHRLVNMLGYRLRVELTDNGFIVPYRDSKCTCAFQYGMSECDRCNPVFMFNMRSHALVAAPAV